MLFMSSAPFIAGGEINLVSLINTIDDKKFDIHVLYQPSSSLNEYIFNKDVDAQPFQFIEISRKNILWLIIMTLKFAIYVVYNRINCIYANTINDLKVLWPIIKLLNIPTIAHIHIDEDDSSLRWMGIHNADRILFPSDYLKDVTLEHSPWIDRTRCYSVHNAVDTNIYRVKDVKKIKDDLGYTDDLPVIGIVGQLKEIKGQHLFLDMAKRLVDDGFKAHFLMVGDDNLENGRYYNYLKDLARRYHLEDIVDFVGYRKDIPDVMSLLDLLICPSLREPFGRVVIEAMACGTPVVASAVGGIVEIFKDNCGGRFFRVGDVESLIDNVIFFFKNISWWQEQKKVAFEHIQRNFTQELHTRKIEEHIYEVVRKHTVNE